jgi:hypothetical protein
VAIIPLGPEHQVWQLRAQWSSRGFASGESSWSFVTVRDPGDDGSDLYVLWRDHLEPLFCAARPALWALEDVLIEDRWPNTRAVFIVDYGGGLSPDSDGETAPPASTPVITWQSDHPGRSYRGRTYWGPIRQEDVDAGWHVGGDAQGAIDDFSREMLDTFGVFAAPDNPAFAIVSRTHDGILRSPPVFTRVTNRFPRQYLGVYRRRNRATRIFV